MRLPHPKQAPFGDYARQNSYDYNWLKRWRLKHDEQYDVTLWMRGDDNRMALLAAPWDPETKDMVLLMARLTCVAEQCTNISVLSEAWTILNPDARAPGMPIRDHETKQEAIIAALYYAQDGCLWERSRAGLMVRNDAGKVTRIQEIHGENERGPVLCAEGAGVIPDGLRGALIYRWPDEVREQVKQRLEQMHQAVGELITVH